MKKAILIGSTALLLVSATTIVRSPQEASSQQEGPTVATNITELIDNIAVPYDVLLDAQMEHAGYAVTGASKGIREGRDVYRLHIETSDNTSSRRNIYLIYNLQWQLIGEETTFDTAPAPKQEAAPVVEETEMLAQPEVEVVPEPEEVEIEDVEQPTPPQDPEEESAVDEPATRQP